MLLFGPTAAFSIRHGSDLRGGAAAVIYFEVKSTWVTRITSFWHNPG
jgi:hypothetical protein